MKRWQFWNLKNVPSVNNREHIEARWDAETNELALLNTFGGERTAVYMARINVNPQHMQGLARIVADLVSEAQKHGYIEAQRDIQRALGL